MFRNIKGMLKDESSATLAEYAIIFSLIGLVGLLFAFSAFNFRSAEICALNVSSRIAGYSAEENQDSCILDKKWSLRDLSRHLAISVESARLLYKDEPDVVRLSALLRKKGAPYCIPDSVARRVYCHHGGQKSRFADDHSKIRAAAAELGCGRETMRLLVLNEPGVLRVRLGKKKSHWMYSITRPVLLQLRTRLLNGS